MKKQRKSSGIVIIGNEILSGKTLETNSNYMCNQLFNIGVECEEIKIIKNNKLKIIETVRLFSKKFSYVFTSGGIGPTHDDITTAAITEAFNQKLCLNEEAKKRLKKHYSDDVLTKARLKMAYLPEKCRLIDNPVSIAPGFVIKNVYVLPGVPKIFQIMAKEIIKSLDEGKRYYKKTVSTKLSEGIIGGYIEKIQKKFHSLEIGSYPYFKKNSFGVSLVLTGENIKRIKEACELLITYLDENKGNPRLF